MFETESAKYADEHCGKCCTEDEYRLCKVDFQRGAEFSYAEANKNEKEASCHKKNIKSVTDKEKVENYIVELEEENEN